MHSLGDLYSVNDNGQQILCHAISQIPDPCAATAVPIEPVTYNTSKIKS